MKTPTNDHLRDATTLWGFDSDCKFIRRVANFVYQTERDGKQLILRLTDVSYRSEEQIHAELEWVNHLAKSGIDVAGPVLSLDGRLVVSVGDTQQRFLASVFHFAPGKPVKGVNAIEPRLIKTWARTLAQFHTLSFPPGASKVQSRPSWRVEPVLQGVMDAIASGDVEPSDQLDSALSWMESLGQEKNSFGLVHADLHLGNFFVETDGRMTVFDFDDCCFHWFGYDCAVSVVSVSFAAVLAGAPVDIQGVARQFSDCYAQERFWGANDFERLLKFARYRLVLMALWGRQQKALGILDAKSLAWCSKYEEWAQLCLQKLPIFC